MAYKAVIAGASGLVGGDLLQVLLQHDEYDEVLAIVRKELPIKHKKLVQLVINYDKLTEYAGSITGHALFCCLGTTRAKTPALKDYRKIDHNYPLILAQLARQNGVGQYHLVSAIGANSSSINFYSKIKGETEEDIQKVGLDTLHIYQPSLLVGDRKENSRVMEGLLTKVMSVLNPLLIGSLKKYRSIKTSQVAYAMFRKSLDNSKGVVIHTTDKIQEIK
jgi:uncharacterized protein YbjT (DUF2867 family)